MFCLNKNTSCIVSLAVIILCLNEISAQTNFQQQQGRTAVPNNFRQQGPLNQNQLEYGPNRVPSSLQQGVGVRSPNSFVLPPRGGFGLGGTYPNNDFGFQHQPFAGGFYPMMGNNPYFG